MKQVTDFIQAIVILIMGSVILISVGTPLAMQMSFQLKTMAYVLIFVGFFGLIIYVARQFLNR